MIGHELGRGMSSNAGITAQKGFFFQMQVFLLRLVGLSRGDAISYEALDDVAVEYKLPANESAAFFTDKNAIMLVQVKCGAASTSVVTKAICNWILQLSQHPDISGFQIVAPAGKGIASKPFEQTPDEFLAIVNEKAAGKRPNALFSRVRNELNDDEIRECFSFIKTHYDPILIDNIDASIRTALDVPLQRGVDDCSGIFFEKRIAELQGSLLFDIQSAMSKDKPYRILHEQFMEKCSCVVQNISKRRYAPNYYLFSRATNASALLSEGGRHVEQLRYCDLDEADLIDHLKFMSYYGHIRQTWLTWAREDRMLEIESTTYANYRSVRMALKGTDGDHPARRLCDTKDKANSATDSDQERWGSCVYLTRDDADDALKISWKE